MKAMSIIAIGYQDNGTYVLKIPQDVFNEFINNPLDFKVNAKLGEEYEKQGQGAAALSYFLRAAELSNKFDKELSYCCLLKTWKQVNKIGRRKKWEKSFSIFQDFTK